MLTVVTWNLENLYRPGGAFGPKTQGDYDAKLALIAATIDSINADVVAVQEVGQPAALDDLVQGLAGSWHVRLSTKPDPRGIRVGFLTRVAMIDSADVVDLPPHLASLQADDTGALTTRMGRGAVHITLPRPAGGGTVEVVTAHLKSKLLSYPGGRFAPLDEDERARFGAYALYRRTAEAATVRCFANLRLGGDGQHRALVVVGDLNDGPEAATTQILSGPGGSELGTAGAAHADAGDGSRLWNLAPLLGPGETFSRIYRGREELIDHIFVSHALHKQVAEMRSLTHRGLPSIDDNPAAPQPARDSDHAPVYARFNV